jgi:5-methylcytosine-specific restriction endonuclease McrA
MSRVWNAEKKRRELHRRQNGRCAICGAGLSLRGLGHDAPTLDHIIPWSAGGPSALSNLRLAHKRRNELRGAEVGSVSVIVDGRRVLRAEFV